MKNIILKDKPKKDIKDGLLARFNKETRTETTIALADINKGQRVYSMPHDKRKLLGIYLRIK